jgi:hypothetical protein
MMLKEGRNLPDIDSRILGRKAGMEAMPHRVVFHGRVVIE